MICSACRFEVGRRAAYDASLELEHDGEFVERDWEVGEAADERVLYVLNDDRDLVHVAVVPGGAGRKRGGVKAGRVGRHQARFSLSFSHSLHPPHNKHTHSLSFCPTLRPARNAFCMTRFC